MTNMRWLIPGFVVAITLAACDSKDNLLSVRDGAADTRNGTGGGSGGSGTGGAAGRGGATGTGGAGTVGTGGAPSGGAVGSGGVGSGGVIGSGGATSTGVSGRGGSGGVAGVSGTGGVAGISGTGGLGTGGGGASTKTDGAIADAANDAALRSDGGDAVVACAPGYPVGSSKPSSDGCGVCVCTTGGIWGCTGSACPPDGGTDAPTDGGAAVDTGVPACKALTTEADCRARTDCHAIYSYQDPAVCGCPTVDCCIGFSRCAVGKPDCVPPAQFSCTIAQPYCGGAYVLSYVGGCFEGCVLGTDCSGLSSCSPAPTCGADEVPVRVQRPATGEVQCACEPNPCPSSLLPTCDCAAELCTKYPGVSCVGYMPGSGQLVCTEEG